MRREPFLSPDKETFPDEKRRVITSSDESSSIPKRSPWHRLEGSLPNTRDIAKYLARKNCKDYHNTPFGITPLNCSLEPLHPYPVDSFPLPRARLLKRRNL